MYGGGKVTRYYLKSITSYHYHGLMTTAVSRHSLSHGVFPQAVPIFPFVASFAFVISFARTVSQKNLLQTNITLEMTIGKVKM